MRLIEVDELSRSEGEIKAGFVYDLPKLIPSVPAFDLAVQEGGSAEASFTVRAEDGSTVSGEALSDSVRIRFSEDRFRGTEGRIAFSLDAAGLLAGDEVNTSVLVRSNLSEIRVPVHVSVRTLSSGEFGDEVQTLDDFSRVCRKSLREGFRLFTSPAFPGILNGNNRQYLALYKGMSKNPVTYQHLEEFLVSTGKKKPIEISLDKQEKAVYHLDASQKDTLYVYRSGWGYIRLEVEVEGDFLEVGKRVITNDDFIGKVYGLEYIVHRDKLGEGKAYGTIRIRSVHQTIVYQIEASAHGESEILPSAVRSRRIGWLMRDYLNLQLHILDFPGWAESSAMTIGEMLEDDPSDSWAMLYKAFLEYSKDENAAAMETLWPFKDGTIRPENEEQKGLYLYLAKEIGLLPAESRDILPTLRRYSMRHPSSYLLLKLVHNEEDPDEVVSADRMQEYADCFRAGCTSPFLYLDAWDLLSGEEALLRRLSSFAVQVLCFGQKNGTISEGLLQRAAFLSGNRKHFSRPLFRLLAEGWKKYPDDDILEAICKLIIKGDPVREEFFPWYARAVERDVRVTRLYEYYMETYHAPAGEELPLPIRMYFATNNTLGEKKKALLYASIVLHKAEDETSYLNYAKQMRAFALDGLKAGRIDANYAVLYREFFADPAGPEEAELLANVLFARKITVHDPGIRRVIVSQTALQKEVTAIVRDGVAYPRIYTEDACILFEDASQRRYATTIPYEEESLMDPKDAARKVLDCGIDHAGTELYICREKAFQMEVSSANISVFRMAAGNSAFTDSYRKLLRRKLLAYDMQHPEEEPAPDAVPENALALYAEADPESTAELLVRQGRLEDVFRIAAHFGPEKIGAKRLSRAVSFMIGQEDLPENPVPVKLAWYVFDKGEAGPDILSFLVQKYNGSVKDMCRLWSAAAEEKLPSTSLAERILLTSVRTHQFPDFETDILRSCIRQQGRQEVINAFLAYLADYYFLGGRQTAGQVFIIMEGAIQRGELNYTICKLAVLKYYSEIGTLNNARTELCRQLLGEMNGKGYRFEFYTRLPKALTQEYQIEDRVFIEEQFRPDSRVVLHYRMSEQDGTEGEWMSEPMRNVYHGIFVREFLLFYGETLTYYLSITEDGRTRNTDSYQVSLVDMDTSGTTRYRLLNRMLEAREKNDRETLGEAMDRYLIQDAFTEQFLKMMQ